MAERVRRGGEQIADSRCRPRAPERQGSRGGGSGGRIRGYAGAAALFFSKGSGATGGGGRDGQQTSGPEAGNRTRSSSARAHAAAESMASDGEG